MDAEGVECIDCDRCAEDAFRYVGAGDIGLDVVAEAGDGGECAGLLAERANPAFGQNDECGSGDAHQPVLLRIRQRSQQDGIHQRVDDCVGADAERQREHSGDGEARRPAHLAQRKAHVLQNALDRRQRGALAIGLAGLLGAAQPKYSLPTRFLCAQASAHRIVSIHGDMAFELGIKFNCFFANEHAAQSHQQSARSFSMMQSPIPFAMPAWDRWMRRGAQEASRQRTR